MSSCCAEPWTRSRDSPTGFKQQGYSAEGPNVTLLQEADADLATSLEPAGPSTPRRSVRLADIGIVPAVSYWALPLTHAVGGRNAGKEGVELLLLILAAVCVKPWRHLPRTALVLGVWLAGAALLIPALSPTGWRGSDDAAGYVCAVMGCLVAAGWARDGVRRNVLAGMLCLAGLDQLTQALVPWWGGQDPSALLIGTFYWHNPFAAFLLPPALLAFGLVTWRSRPWQLVGWVAAPLCTAGIVLSSSRAVLAVLVLGWAGIGAAAIRRGDRRRLALRFAAVSAASIAVTELLPGPPLFSHRVSPLGAGAARTTAGETLSANGGYRLEFWRSALETFRHHPLVGSGYHGLIETGRAYTSAGWARSNLAHNGYLQALSDGGLLLGLPLIASCAVLAWLSLRSLVDFLRSDVVTPLEAVASLGLLAALAHSGVDFDWSHSALFMMDAFLAAVVLSARRERRATSQGPPVRRLGAAAVILLTLGGAGLGNVGRVVADSPEHTGSLPAYVSALTTAAGRPFAGDGSARILLGLALTSPEAVSPEERRLAVDKTGREATIDLDLAAQRGLVALSYGNRAPATTAAARLSQVEPGRPAYAISLAPLLAGLGRRAEGEALLRPLVSESLASRSAATLPDAEAWSATAPTGDPAASCILELAQNASAGDTPTCHSLIAAALGA